MAYKYSETRKHILTPELILNDLKKDNKEAKVMSIFLLILPPLLPWSLPLSCPLSRMTWAPSSTVSSVVWSGLVPYS